MHWLLLRSATAAASTGLQSYLVGPLAAHYRDTKRAMQLRTPAPPFEPKRRSARHFSINSVTDGPSC